MKILVTGSSGHLGEALVRGLSATSHQVATLHRCLRGADAVVHAATLHKPHVAIHCRTVTLLPEAIAAEVGAFV